jgi:hypothetical protein
MRAVSFLITLLSITILILPLGDLLSLITGERISVLFRGCVTLLIISLIYTYRRSIKFNSVLVFGGLGACLIFLSGLFYSENINSSFDYIELVNFLIKIIMPILFWLVLVELEDNTVKLVKIHKYLFFTLMLYVLAIPVSAILGFDLFKTYGSQSGRFGFSGIVPAANETSGLLFAAMGAVCILYLKKQLKHYLLALFSILIAAMLLGTKGGIIGVFILTFGLLYAKRGLLFSLSLCCLFLAIFSFCLALIYFNFEAVRSAVELSVGYFQYQLANGANGSIINLLLSGRLDKLQTVFIDVEHMFYIPLVLGGVDVLSYAVEMDFFDVLFLLGLPFTFFIFYFWFNIFVLKSRNIPQISRFMVVFFIGWFLLSFLAGHFIYSAVASLYFVYVSSLAANKDT